MPKKEVKSKRWEASFGIATWSSGLLAVLKKEGTPSFCFTF